ncbi:hypothetical protein [Endozoicomonas euniceicola]|uniref:Uncharacterized protein n=1 Tax=Endozoicomonas euniceicola TaxID=1234143 RepID=A0ABY6GNH3_9GAMM|nr:hypothetical protein [Endozoicomonas euniceicola]UYM14258.1 hypothetical protein NX720_15275 [Endozoicomonas euniceicola]
MANGKIETGLDLNEWHQSVIDGLKTLKAFKTVAEYPREKKKIVTPAAFLELTAIQAQADDNANTEQLPVTLEAEVRIICGYRTKEVKRYIRLLAAQVAHYLDGQRFGVPSQPARVGGCWPDEFDTELDNYEVWRVVFTQDVLLGATVFDDSGIIPESVYVGFAPDIGKDHEDDYTKVV